MKKQLIKYQSIIGFILGILTTLVAQTATKSDDEVIKGLQNSFNEFIKENVVVTPTTVN